PSGRFAFDVFNPKIAFLAQSGGARTLEREYDDPDGQGKIAMEQMLVYDDAAQVSRIGWYFTRNSPNGEEEEDFRVEELSLRCFYPQELDLLVRSQGFEIVEKFGNFERKPFGSGDVKQVLICR